MTRSVRPSTEKVEYSKASGPSTGWRMRLTASPWTSRMSLLRHITLNSGLSWESSDERLHLRCSTSTRDIHTECTDDVARHAFPVILHGAGTRIEEDNAQHIALVRRQRAKVAQHNSGRPIPGKDVPGCRANERRAGVQSVEDALKAGRDSFLLMVAGLRRSPKAKQEEVLALDIRQHQGPRDPVEHIG